MKERRNFEAKYICWYINDSNIIQWWWLLEFSQINLWISWTIMLLFPKGSDPFHFAQLLYPRKRHIGNNSVLLFLANKSLQCYRHNMSMNRKKGRFSVWKLKRIVWGLLFFIAALCEPEVHQFQTRSLPVKLVWDFMRIQSCKCLTNDS